MNVLRASPRVPPLVGGQEVHVSELSRSLAELGVRQMLCFAEGSPRIEGVVARRLRTPTIGSNIARDALFGTELAAMTSSGFDVVHTHGDAPVARGGAIAAARARAPHVHTFHGELVGAGVRGFILRSLLPSRTWYLAVSRRVAASIARAGGRRDRIFVRTSGVRDDFFRTADEPRDPNVIVGGRLIPEKRISETVRAWAEAETGDSRLVVFGAGPDAMKIARIAEAASNVSWLGELDASSLAAAMSRAAVGVVMGREARDSSSNEGTPTLALEMLASGCLPVVGAGTGEAPRTVEEMRFGLVSPDMPDPSWLIDLARSVCGSAMDLERRRVRADALSRFSWDRVSGDVLRFYDQLLERGDPERGGIS